jgi:hypothetical protein
LYYPLLREDLIVEIELDLDDRSEMIRVERGTALCELLNGDIGKLCGWPNFRNKLVSFVLAYFDLLIVLAQVYSCLEFDLTLSVIPSD